MHSAIRHFTQTIDKIKPLDCVQSAMTCMAINISPNGQHQEAAVSIIALNLS